MTIIQKLREHLFHLRARFSDVYGVRVYSQEGEDMVLRRIFDGKREGFFVDVGAHHPSRFSNTQYFYRRGWRGINIEPNPDAISVFQRCRKSDVNLQYGVAETQGVLKYYRFDEPALNSFDAALVQDRLDNTSYKVIDTILVPVRRLDEILSEHLSAGQHIDFLTIDVEGLDFEVLKSNNWSLYRPSCVLVEALESSLDDAANNELYKFMKENDYTLFAKTFNTWIFRAVLRAA